MRRSALIILRRIPTQQSLEKCRQRSFNYLSRSAGGHNEPCGLILPGTIVANSVMSNNAQESFHGPFFNAEGELAANISTSTPDILTLFEMNSAIVN